MNARNGVAFVVSFLVVFGLGMLVAQPHLPHLQQWTQDGVTVVPKDSEAVPRDSVVTPQLSDEHDYNIIASAAEKDDVFSIARAKKYLLNLKARAAETRLIHLHIPKTGGTSFAMYGECLKSLC